MGAPKANTPGDHNEKNEKMEENGEYIFI